jgi:hypothetical protein
MDQIVFATYASSPYGARQQGVDGRSRAKRLGEEGVPNAF